MQTNVWKFEYNAAGYRTRRTVGSTSTITEYGYDAAGRLTGVTNKAVRIGTNWIVSSYAYGYDNSGNRRWVKRLSNRGDVYTYDPADQVTNVIYDAATPDGTPGMGTNQTRYVIDAAGNWSSRVQINPTVSTNTFSYTANALNQYSSIGGVTQYYDTKGNLTSDGTNTYVYDYENRLNKSFFPASGTTFTNVYDVLGRWVARKRGPLWTYYYYAGWQLIEERDRNNVQMAKYVYGAGLDEPVRALKNGVYYYYLTDGLGSVTEVTDASGNLVEQYNYDVYGAPTIRNAAGAVLSASSFTNRWFFTGRDWDAEQLVYNYRYRWYSPTLGRFVQTDPIVTAGWLNRDPIGERGGINLYEFCRNDPVCVIDPLGLKDYTYCETRALMEDAKKDATSGIFSGLYHLLQNHSTAGKFDFKIGQDVDTFQPWVLGPRLGADQFGNYLGGYAGVSGYGNFGYLGMRAGGIYYGWGENRNAGSGPVKLFDDPGSIAMINAGARDAITRTTIELGRPLIYRNAPSIVR